VVGEGRYAAGYFAGIGYEEFEVLTFMLALCYQVEYVAPAFAYRYVFHLQPCHNGIDYFECMLRGVLPEVFVLQYVVFASGGVTYHTYAKKRHMLQMAYMGYRCRFHIYCNRVGIEVEYVTYLGRFRHEYVARGNQTPAYVQAFEDVVGESADK
jgi:hypothetical protein